MSERQLRLLRWLASYNIAISHLDMIHNITLWSLFHRGYITFNGKLLVVTRLGQDVLHNYEKPLPVITKHPHSLTTRLLKYFKVRRIA